MKFTTPTRGLLIEVQEVFLKKSELPGDFYNVVFKSSDNKYYTASVFKFKYQSAKRSLDNWKAFALNKTLVYNLNWAYPRNSPPAPSF